MKILEWELANAKTMKDLKNVLIGAGAIINASDSEIEKASGFMSENEGYFIMLGENIREYPSEIPRGLSLSLFYDYYKPK